MHSEKLKIILKEIEKRHNAGAKRDDIDKYINRQELDKSDLREVNFFLIDLYSKEAHEKLDRENRYVYLAIGAILMSMAGLISLSESDHRYARIILIIGFSLFIYGFKRFFIKIEEEEEPKRKRKISRRF